MGATLEIQQSQRMEILEQQMLLSQARQFSRQRNRAVRFGRPVSDLNQGWVMGGGGGGTEQAKVILYSDQTVRASEGRLIQR